jgi:hypothetical protein
MIGMQEPAATAESRSQNARLLRKMPSLLLIERVLVARHQCPCDANRKLPADLVETAKKDEEIKQLGIPAMVILQLPT